MVSNKGWISVCGFSCLRLCIGGFLLPVLVGPLEHSIAMGLVHGGFPFYGLFSRECIDRRRLFTAVYWDWGMVLSLVPLWRSPSDAFASFQRSFPFRQPSPWHGCGDLGGGVVLRVGLASGLSLSSNRWQPGSLAQGYAPA